MKLIPHLLGLTACLIVLYLTFPPVGSTSPALFYTATSACSYILFSSLALGITRFGRTRKTKAWAFFIGGIVAIVAFMPGIRYVVDLFYVEDRSWREPALTVMKELYFLSPIFVGSLCIYRAITMWADESLTSDKPNQALQPTPMLVTPRADARVAPSTGVADL